VDAAAAARVLPAPLEPAEVDGESIVSLGTFRCTGGRLGALPLLPFSQLNVRVYAEHRGEPAVFFLRSYVTLGGMGGTLFGAPYRPAWLRARRGHVRGLGIDIRYGVDDATEGRPGLLGRHELGVFEGIGLRAIRVRRGPAAWHPATATREPRTDLLTALGFDVSGPPRLVYAPEAAFETDVPAQRLD
jgi:hypothetical protein